MSVMKPSQSALSTLATTDHDPIIGTPWEKVAYPIPPNASIPELLQAAKLNWGLLHLPLDTGIPVDKIPEHMIPEGYEVKEGGKIYVPVPKHYCLRRADNLEILSPYMGNRYKPIENEYAFSIFDQFVRAGEMTLESAGSLHGGKHVFGLAKIGKNFTLADGETIEGYFLLIQSHAYGHSLKAMFTPIRYPSGNTLVTKLANVKDGYYAMPHSRVFDDARIEEIKDVVTGAERQLRDFQRTAEFLASSHIEAKDGIFYLAKLFDSKLINRRKADKKPLPSSYHDLLEAEDANRVIKKVALSVIESPGAQLESCKGTAWGLFQGVVHALDHVNGHNTDTRLEASWIGKDAGIKVKALDMSVVMASKAK